MYEQTVAADAIPGLTQTMSFQSPDWLLGAPDLNYDMGQMYYMLLDLDLSAAMRAMVRLQAPAVLNVFHCLTHP